jgi:hypothetical protein
MKLSFVVAYQNNFLLQDMCFLVIKCTRERSRYRQEKERQVQKNILSFEAI